jgi:hypothetical protein
MYYLELKLWKCNNGSVDLPLGVTCKD